jgi:hypothetical protein
MAAKLRNTVRGEISAVSKNYSLNLGSLVDAVLTKHPKDAQLQGVVDKFNILRREDPMRTIELGGPHLWKYREQIHAENVNFFLNNNFKEDIVTGAAACNQVIDSSQIDSITDLLDKVKLTWHMYSESEQGVLIKKIKAALACYAKYISLQKQLQALENQ